jgi:hypothetical protein
MPNWCSNTVFVTGPADVARKLRATMTTGRSRFDFNAVLPMPEPLRQSESSALAETAWELKYGDWADVKWKYGPDHFDSREAALAAARDADDWRPRVIASGEDLFPVIAPRSFDDLADAVQQLIDEHGYPDWYSWAVANWGTKWPAADAGWMSTARAAKRDAEQVAYFNTAWSPATPVIVALSQRFPALTLRLEYCEPHWAFRGFTTAKAGQVIADKHETYDMYAECMTLSHNLSEHADAIYIGHERAAEGDLPAFAQSKWANPFATADRSPKQAVDLYLKWIKGDTAAALMLPPGKWNRPNVDDIQTHLSRSTLLCDCNTAGIDCKGCHGYLLMSIASGWDGEEEDFADDDRDDKRLPDVDFVARVIEQ